MSIVIPIAHDYNCPWCWIGMHQVKRLQAEFGVTFDWLGYELYPEWMEWGDGHPEPERPANKPETPTRLQLAMAAEGIEHLIANRPKKMRTHKAHEATEYAKTLGVQDKLIERLYRAHWEQAKNLDDLAVVLECAEGLIPDLADLEKAITERRFAAHIVEFDDPAYEAGVYNVPTLWIGNRRWAEQPTMVLRKAISREIARVGG